MSGSVNKVILVGRLTRDPEIRTLNSGDRVANLSLATSETWRDKSSGEKKEKSEFHNVVIFNEHIVKTVENYCRKGSTVYVEGSLQTRKYEQAGVEKYATEVVLQKFNGSLTLLGGGPSRDEHDQRTDDGFHSEGSGGVAGSDRHGRGQDAGRRAAYEAELSDPGIPF